MNDEKIYTQQDLDAILSKKEESWSKQYAKNHIDLKEFNELKEQYDNLNTQLKSNFVKEQFLKHNGMSEAFDDFIMSNKNLLDVEPKDLGNHFKELQEKKPYFFQEPNTAGLDNKEVFKSIDKAVQDNDIEDMHGWITYRGEK